MRSMVVWAAVWLFLVALATARDIHVDNLAGDDRSDGQESGTAAGARGPVRTIAKALRLAQAGDHVVLASTAQPYRESVGLTGSKHSGGPLGPLVIEGNGAVLDGSTDVPSNAWRHYEGDVFAFQPACLGYQQLFVGGRPAARRPAARMLVELPPLAPLEWCYTNGRIYFRVESGRLPRDYLLACCGLRTGITLYHVRDVVIRNLVVEKFQFDGIAASDSARDARLQGVTCRANGRSGISVSGASIVALTNCVLSGNGDSQLDSDRYGQTYIYESRLIADTAPAIAMRGGRVRVDGRLLSE